MGGYHYNISWRNKMGRATDWIHLAQYTDKWQDLVNAIMNLQVPLNSGNFLASSESTGF
jgi:hypothetical protein